MAYCKFDLFSSNDSIVISQQSTSASMDNSRKWSSRILLNFLLFLLISDTLFSYGNLLVLRVFKPFFVGVSSLCHRIHALPVLFFSRMFVYLGCIVCIAYHARFINFIGAKNARHRETETLFWKKSTITIPIHNEEEVTYHTKCICNISFTYRVCIGLNHFQLLFCTLMLVFFSFSFSCFHCLAAQHKYLFKLIFAITYIRVKSFVLIMNDSLLNINISES